MLKPSSNTLDYTISHTVRFLQIFFIAGFEDSSSLTGDTGVQHVIDICKRYRVSTAITPDYRVT